MLNQVEYNPEKLKHLSVADLYAIRMYADELITQWEKNPKGTNEDLMKNYWCPVLLYASEEIRNRISEAFITQ